MLLYQIAGLSSAPPAELGAQDLELLEALLEAKVSQAIAAGVRLDLEQWAGLDELERRCWSVAYRRLQVRRWCEFLAAQRDELRAAELYAEVDGGEVHDDILMDRVMHTAMMSMGGS